jgi:hypothetical protein
MAQKTTEQDQRISAVLELCRDVFDELPAEDREKATERLVEYIPELHDWAHEFVLG